MPATTSSRLLSVSAYFRIPELSTIAAQSRKFWKAHECWQTQRAKETTEERGVQMVGLQALILVNGTIQDVCGHNVILLHRDHPHSRYDDDSSDCCCDFCDPVRSLCRVCAAFGNLPCSCPIRDLMSLLT